ncbi:MAG: GtrA family protein [Clostridia bacterium]|nr:GtrA family protein [Clostridia bacterium]
MIKKIYDLALTYFNKYKRPILYLFFGGLTTVINVVVYAICARVFNLPTIPSTIIAWMFAVSVAFIANKLWVFESKNKAVFKELTKFFACRIGTGTLDVIVMFVTVDLLFFNEIIMKLISNIIVIILNYIFSKLIVFKK